MRDFFRKHRTIILPSLILVIIFAALSYFNFGHHNFTLKNIQTDDGKDLNYYYQKAQDLAKQQNQTTDATFLAVGDIMLSRNVAAAISKTKNPLLPFGNIAEILKTADFNFGNLESTFAISDQSAIIGGHSLDFASPPENIQGLSENNFKILNLANNHAFDQGLKGLEFTTQYLDANHIQHTGTGETLDKAWQPAVVAAQGLKICFIGASYASNNDGGKTSNNYVARMEDTQNLRSAISKSKALCDFVVVSMHAGTEYTRRPNQAQINFAHLAIDDGADMVIGAHPHWIQTTETYKNKYIFYSLGNFIFDQNWSQNTREGLALEIQISKTQISNPIAPQAASLDDLQGNRIPAQLEAIKLMPIIIENNGVPRLANEQESQQILKKIGETKNILK